MEKGSGITLQIFDVQAQVIMEKFFIEGNIKSVGSLDDNFNNENYNYVAVSNGVALPWHQSNPVQPISYPEIHLRIHDILLASPVDPEEQSKIKLMANSEKLIFYMGEFAVCGKLTMGEDQPISGIMDAMPKRFLVMTEASIFPMFPASITLPETMPVALLNRLKVTHYHLAEE